MGRVNATLRLAAAAAIGVVTIAMLPTLAHAAPVSVVESCSDGPRVDFTPPSVPGNARYTAGQMTTLSWDPSADDAGGVIQYQVFHRTQQIATTTQTSITIQTPPPMVTTYGVRAVDAAGNISPFAPIQFGWMPGSSPPTAPSNMRVTAICENSLTVSWEPSRDDSFVVGYEIYINGALFTKVGSPGAHLPWPLYPKHADLLLMLRAWDNSYPSYAYSPYYTPSEAIWPDR